MARKSKISNEETVAIKIHRSFMQRLKMDLMILDQFDNSLNIGDLIELAYDKGFKQVFPEAYKMEKRITEVLSNSE